MTDITTCEFIEDAIERLEGAIWENIGAFRKLVADYEGSDDEFVELMQTTFDNAGCWCMWECQSDGMPSIYEVSIHIPWVTVGEFYEERKESTEATVAA